MANRESEEKVVVESQEKKRSFVKEARGSPTLQKGLSLMRGLWPDSLKSGKGVLAFSF